MKRKFSSILMLASTVLLLVACVKNQTPTPTDQVAPEKTSSSNSQEPVKVPLTLWHYYTSEATQNALTKLIDDYNASGGKAQVKQQLIPRDELMKKYTLGITTGDLPDLAVIDNPDSAAYSAMGLFTDLTEQFNATDHNQFQEGPLATGTYQDKIYTLPFRYNALAVWVNTEMFEAAGIDTMPTTWTEFLETCKKLKDRNPGVYPFAFAAAKSEEGTFQFIPFLYSAGGSLDDMASEGSVQALTNIKTLVNTGYASNEVINWAQGDVEKQFAAGNAAMMLNGSWQIPNLATDAPDLKYQIISLPTDGTNASCMGGENIGITTSCDNMEAAWDFLTYATSKEISIAFNSSIGTISPRSDVTAEEQYPDNDAMQVFAQQMAYAIARGPSPKWSEISENIQIAIQAVLIDAETPAQAGSAAAKKIGEINATLK